MGHSSQLGLYMLSGYEDGKITRALDMLLVDRKNEFREMTHTVLARVPPGLELDEDKVVINFCLDVADAFKTWTGDAPLVNTSTSKALTVLRQLGRGKTSMNQLSHMLNLAYDLAEEFKVIYKRIG
jgi:hypothetical protein